MAELFPENPEHWGIPENFVMGIFTPPYYGLHALFSGYKRDIYALDAAGAFLVPGVARAYIQHKIERRKIDKNDQLGFLGAAVLDTATWGFIGASLLHFHNVNPFEGVGFFIGSRLGLNALEGQVISATQRQWRKHVLSRR